MSQAEELLNSLDASNTSGESHIVIGKDRFITVPDSLKRLAVQYDHDIETVTFDCPRYWDEHDMSTMTIYVNYLCADNEPGCYKVKNVAVDPTDSTIMHFDWVISKNVTMAAGQIAFLVCIKKTDAEGVEKNHWNSEICKDCYISPGIEYGDGDINKIYPDILAQWRQEVLAITDDIVAARENGEFQGEPGVSPTIQVSDIEGGHRVTITDVEGTKTFDIMDTIVDGTDAVNELLNRFVSIAPEVDRSHSNLLFYTDRSDSATKNFDHEGSVYLSYIDGTGFWHAFYPRTKKELVFGMDEIDNFITASKGITAHSDNGRTYTATVPGITELAVGASFLMIPDKDAVNGNPELNINNFGKKLLTYKHNVSTIANTQPDQEIEDFCWLKSGEPISVTYNGKVWVADITLINGSGRLLSPVSINNGGTGTTSIEQAAKNLKFNSLAYATELTKNLILDELVDAGKYHILAKNFNDNTLVQFPFKDWNWCTITVEDAQGKGHTIPNEVTSEDSYILQTIVNDNGDKFSRMITFKNGQFYSSTLWARYITSESPLVISPSCYGTDFPHFSAVGTVFFKKNDGCYIYEGAQNGWVKYF